MKKWILPTKSIDKEKIQYEWVAEKTACEVCQSMNGIIYDSANDIPDRPHPNCKCHIEIIEKESDEPVSDPLESLKKEREEELRVKMDVQKLLGDTKSLMEEIDEYLRQVDVEEQKFRDFQQVVDVEKLEADDRQKLTGAIEKIEFAKYRGEKVKKDVAELQNKTVILEGKVEKIRILGPILEQIKKGLEALLGAFAVIAAIVKELIIVAWEQLKKGNADILKKLAFKILVADTYGEYHTSKYNMPESGNLYKVGSPEYLYNKKYVEQNGKMYDSIDELNNYKLEKDIHSRVKTEMGLKDCKVLKLRPDSSIAKEIEQSNTLKTFLNDYGKQLKNGETISYAKVTFESQDSDLYSAIHGGVFKNAYIDKSTKIMHISAEDLWNFEKRITSMKAIAGRYLQDNGLLVPYYLIIDVQIPQSVWEPLIK